jgi:hypothetical protein
MRSMAVIVTLEIEELHLQIRGGPEQGAVHTFAPNGANQPCRIVETGVACGDSLDELESTRAIGKEQAKR